MKQQILALVRHGQSEANAKLTTTEDGLFYSLSRSDKDVPLTDDGLKHAAHVAKTLARVFPRQRKVARIYHTDFKRVLQMLPATQQRLPYKVKHYCDSRLNKRSYGQFWNLTHKGVQVLHSEEWQRYQQDGDLHYRPPEGENYLDLFARVDDFVDNVLAPTRGNVVVFTHSVVLLSLQRRLEGLSDAEVLSHYEQQTLPNGHILFYTRANRHDAWQRCTQKSLLEKR